MGFWKILHTLALWLVHGLWVSYLGHIHLEYESIKIILFDECLFSIFGIIRQFSRLELQNKQFSNQKHTAMTLVLSVQYHLKSFSK